MEKISIIILIVIVVISLSALLILVKQEKTVDSINLSKTNGTSYNAQINIKDEQVYVVWTDETLGNSETFFARSTNGGNSFEKFINLSSNEGESAFPRFVTTKNDVYVVWYDYTPGQSDVLFAASNDRGETFDKINLSKNTEASYNPWIASTQDYVYVVWNDGGTSQETQFGNETRIFDVILGKMDILFVRTNDGGHSFDGFNISNSKEVSWNPRIVADSSNIFVIWNEGTEDNSEIYFSKSLDYGKTFSKPTNVSDSKNSSFDAGIVVEGRNIYLIWHEEISQQIDIFFSQSKDSGETFSKPTNISNNEGQSLTGRDTQIAANNGEVFVIWYDNTEGDFDVYFSKKAFNDDTFSRPENLSNTSTRSEFPQISIWNPNIYVVWTEHTMNNSEIYLRKSEDSGTSFEGIVNLSNDHTSSNLFILGPQIAANTDGLYAIWENKTVDTSDLILKKFLK